MTAADRLDPLDEEHRMRDSIVAFLEASVERFGEGATSEMVASVLASFAAGPENSCDLHQALVAAKAVRDAP